MCLHAEREPQRNFAVNINICSRTLIMKCQLTANHVQSAFGGVRQHVKLFCLVQVHGQVVDELFSVLYENWDECLKNFQVERVVKRFAVNLPDIICEGNESETDHNTSAWIKLI